MSLFPETPLTVLDWARGIGGIGVLWLAGALAMRPLRGGAFFGRGLIAGLILLVVGVAVANSNKAVKLESYGDGSLTFNWPLFGTFAVGAAVCIVLGLAVGSIVNAIRRR